MTPEERARKSADAMWAGDHASAWLGMRIDRIDEGIAELSLTIEKHHCNGMGICHGGITFSLADSTFAFACNSRNRRTVAQHNTISYLAPGRVGDRLTASAREVQLAGRTGIYDVRVRNQGGDVIAEFRGISRMINGTHFEE